MNYKDKAIHYLNSKIILGLLIVAGLMVAFLSTHFFARMDLTETKQFSISSSTKNLLNNLEEPVNIRVYFSKQLPPEFLKTDQYVKDILGEYQAYSKGNLQVVYLDPAQPDSAKEALSYGIPQLQMNVYAKDRFEVQAGYLGLAVVYEDNFEALPVIEDTSNLEYDLTSAIRKVAAPELKTIGFLTGHGEKDFSDPKGIYQKIKKALEKNYLTKKVDLDSENPLSGVDTLVIAGPKDDFSDEHLLAIDQFIIKGGKTLFLADKVDVDPQVQATSIQSNLDEFLVHLGVKQEGQLVVDRSNENAPFSQGYTTYIVPYHFWVKLIPANFAMESPIMNRLNSLIIPWGSPLTEQKAEGLETVTLAKTTAASGTQKEPFSLNPNAENQQFENSPSLALAVMVSGTYTSYFKENEVEKGEDFIEVSPASIRSVIVGNSRFIEDYFLNRFPQNLNFFMNTIDYLTLDESLIGIRAKTAQDRSIGELSDNMKGVIKFFSIYCVPLLLIIIGGTRAYWIKKVKNLHSK